MRADIDGEYNSTTITKMAELPTCPHDATLSCIQLADERHIQSTLHPSYHAWKDVFQTQWILQCINKKYGAIQDRASFDRAYENVSKELGRAPQPRDRINSHAKLPALPSCPDGPNCRARLIDVHHCANFSHGIVPPQQVSACITSFSSSFLSFSIFFL